MQYFPEVQNGCGTATEHVYHVSIQYLPFVLFYLLIIAH